jgi:hypothetical protein
MDMHSGGGRKLDWEYIFIEAPESEAKSVFYSKFGRSPERVTCTCCGEDYSISEYESLDEASKYDRGKLTTEDYIKSSDVKVIYAKDITTKERIVEVPPEGYVWM